MPAQIFNSEQPMLQANFKNMIYLHIDNQLDILSVRNNSKNKLKTLKCNFSTHNSYRLDFKLIFYSVNFAGLSMAHTLSI
jgi:hypothetical protein